MTQETSPVPKARVFAGSPALLGGAGAIVVACLMLAPWLIQMRGDATRLFCAGRAFAVPAQAAGHLAVFRYPGLGYDGQFYLYASFDPFLRHTFTRASFDHPLARFQRGGLPILVWALSAGHPGLAPWVYLALELLAVGLLGWALAALAGDYLSGLGMSPRRLTLLSVGCGWLAPLFVATMISLMRMTLDGPLVALLCAALVFLQRRWWTAHFACCLLAALTKETGVLAVAAWGLALLMRERRAWPFAGYLVVGAFFLAWYGFLRWRLGALGALTGLPMSEGFAPPFVGIAGRMLRAAQEDRAWAKKAVELVFLTTLLWAILAAVICGMRRVREEPCLALPLIAYAVLCLLLRESWEEDWAYDRLTGPLLAFAACASLRFRSWALGVPVLVQFVYAGFFWCAKAVQISH